MLVPTKHANCTSPTSSNCTTSLIFIHLNKIWYQLEKLSKGDIYIAPNLGNLLCSTLHNVSYSGHLYEGAVNWNQSLMTALDKSREHFRISITVFYDVRNMRRRLRFRLLIFVMDKSVHRAHTH